MSEMVYDAHLEDLYKKYTALPEMEKRAGETLSVLFGGFFGAGFSRGFFGWDGFDGRTAFFASLL